MLVSFNLKELEIKVLNKKIMIRKIIYSLFFLVMVSFSSAIYSEPLYYTIFKKGAWTVDSVKYDAGDYGCLMYNGESDLELRIEANDEIFDLAIFYDNQPEINKSLKYFSFRIDNNASWRDTASYYDEGWLISELSRYSDRNGEDFVNEFNQGNKFYHLNDNFEVISWFSLKGSAMASEAFLECVEKEGNYEN